MFFKPQPPGDPDGPMTGMCGSCKTTVILSRWQAMLPGRPGAAGREPDPFGDLWSCPCPGCSARVYLVPYRPQGS
jgi:hypothetical protein